MAGSSENFDPYYKWLGIPLEEQPPHHYRLLGVRIFESDPEVINHAADQRMVHIRGFQTGKNSALSQKLLNEIAAARLCLVQPQRKTEYDDALRYELAAHPVQAIEHPPVMPPPSPLAAPPASPPPLSPQAAAPAAPAAYRSLPVPEDFGDGLPQWQSQPRTASALPAGVLGGSAIGDATHVASNPLAEVYAPSRRAAAYVPRSRTQRSSIGPVLIILSIVGLLLVGAVVWFAQTDSAGSSDGGSDNAPRVPAVKESRGDLPKTPDAKGGHMDVKPSPFGSKSLDSPKATPPRTDPSRRPAPPSGSTSSGPPPAGVTESDDPDLLHNLGNDPQK